MNMSVSLDVAVFREAEQEAEQMQMSVPDFCALAIQEFAKNRRKSSITKQLDEVYAAQQAVIDEDILQAQYDMLPKENW